MLPRTMSNDPRRVLEEAANRRLACEVMPKRGAWTRCTVVRVEKGGLVITTPERRFDGGEEVRVWLAIDEQPYTFEASVIRAGVPVPDRSQDGLLLGFIDRWTEGPADKEPSPQTKDCLLEIQPPSGPPLSLLEAPARLVEIAVDELAFTVPSDFKLIFVENGTVRVRLGAAGKGPISAEGRVRALAPGEGYLLYGIAFEGVEDAETHRAIVDGLGSLLG